MKSINRKKKENTNNSEAAINKIICHKCYLKYIDESFRNLRLCMNTKRILCMEICSTTNSN